MSIGEQALEILCKMKDLILGLNAEHITLISVLVTLIIFVAGQHSERKFKKHEIRRTEYKKFIALLEQSFTGGIDQTDPSVRKVFFDTGVSLLLYGSKRVYKKYVFFREYTTNPIAQKSKHNDGKVLMYVIADILKTIRHEVGLTSVSELESNEVLSFIVKDVGTNPLSRIDSYKAQYNIFMIKCEMFFFNRVKLVATRKVYYQFIKPVFGVISLLVKYLITSIGKLFSFFTREYKPKARQKEENIQSETDSSSRKSDQSKCHKRQGLVAIGFALEWKAQNWVVHNIWRKSASIQRVGCFCFLILVLWLVMFGLGVIPWGIAFWISGIPSITMLVCVFLGDTQNAMTTLGGFLKVGIHLMVFLLIVILATIPTAFEQIFQGTVSQYFILIIVSVILSLFWGAYSSFCNAEVATLANALLTGGMGLVILTKDFLVKTLCIESPIVFINEEFMAQMASLGFDSSQTIDGVRSQEILD